MYCGPRRRAPDEHSRFWSAREADASRCGLRSPIKAAGFLMAAVLVLFVPSVIVVAQRTPGSTRSTTARASGTVSGRVFGITGSGDLKPARLARVYLLGSTETQTKQSAVTVFLEKYVTGTEELTASLNTDSDLSDEARCRKVLIVADDAILAALDWTKEKKKYSELKSTEADEEGAFRISGVAPGFHMLAIRGRAGANDAYWQADVVVVPGRDVSLKLGSPEKSCIASSP
jgi:hypothetical protein